MKKILAILALVMLAGCTPAGHVSINDAGYNPTTGQITGDIGVDFEFREIVVDGKRALLRVPKAKAEVVPLKP